MAGSLSVTAPEVLVGLSRFLVNFGVTRMDVWHKGSVTAAQCMSLSLALYVGMTLRGLARAAGASLYQMQLCCASLDTPTPGLFSSGTRQTEPAMASLSAVMMLLQVWSGGADSGSCCRGVEVQLLPVQRPVPRRADVRAPGAVPLSRPVFDRDGPTVTTDYPWIGGVDNVLKILFNCQDCFTRCSESC